MPGRQLFGGEAEFWNPDLLTPRAPCDQLIAAGQHHMHELIAYARGRGIDASSVWSLIDFSRDFRSVIPDAQTVNQLGQLTVAPGPRVRPDNPDLLEIGGTVLRTIVDEFPDAHSYGFPCRDRVSQLGRAVRVGLERARQAIWDRAGSTTERGLATRKQASRPLGWRGCKIGHGSEGEHHRAYYLLRLWNSPDVLPRTHKPDARLVVYEVAEELWPILPRIMPKSRRAGHRAGLQPHARSPAANSAGDRPGPTCPDHHGLDTPRRQCRHAAPTDDRCAPRADGRHPACGISGFGTRQWLISDHDASTAYLAKAAWIRP